MATNKNNNTDETQNSSENLNNDSSSKKSTRKSTKKSDSDSAGPAPKKRSLSWKSKSSDIDMLPSSDPDLRDIKVQESMRYSQDTRHRGTLMHWVMKVVSIWLGGILILELLNGLGLINLSENVQIALVATTTTNILALGMIVLKGFFGDVSVNK